MAHKFDSPKTESELRSILDKIYQLAQNTSKEGNSPSFKGLLEIISSEPVIHTAIHNLMANKGSRTPGSDGQVLRDILELNQEQVMTMLWEQFRKYTPKPIRRKYIPKPGKKELRPLGIPAIIDRIIQECVRIVIEPILEAQFFKHSYGFRPMRDTHMALERVQTIVHHTGYKWIVEGDISKFFDHVDHAILIKKLWHMGIHDRRILMIIKAMLKAGIMGGVKENPLGTPQGGIISPLLANAYLDTLDHWVVREWEEKKTRHEYSRHDGKLSNLKKRSKLKPVYLVRYADDWVLITDSKANAEKWKMRISEYLETNLKLKLSKEKTLITNVTKKTIHFLGFTFKTVRGNSKKGYISRTRPDGKRLKAKILEVHKAIQSLRKYSIPQLLAVEINNINAKMRGIIQYYQVATWVNIDLRKYTQILRYAAFLALKRGLGRKKVKWIPANQLMNLQSIHQEYATTVPAFEYEGNWIGITSIAFCKWKKTTAKNPEETLYTERGRRLYSARTHKRPLLVRRDELFSNEMILAKTKFPHPLYNFEFVINRPYAFNRDKGKCRVCRDDIWLRYDLEMHHINPNLPKDKVNKVNNLAAMHIKCHQMVLSKQDYSHINKFIWKRILNFREKLK